MTTELVEPLERRLLNDAAALLATGFWMLLLWHYVNPDGPREAFERLRDKINERRRYHEGMLRTLEQIDELPERELELEPDEEPPG